jgi:hypothetical protein
MNSPAIIFGILLLPTVSHALIDTNTNGVSDLWEQAHNNGQLFPQTFDPQADSDQDGWTNAREAAAGTDPNNANPPEGILRPDIAHIPAVMGTDGNGQPIIITPESVVISWTTLPGKQYTLLRSFDLTGSSWQPFDVPFIGNGNLVEYGYPAADTDRLFLRVAITDVDTDNDGLSDAEENELNTDPSVWDTDEDGLTDIEEIAQETDPNDSDTDDDLILDGNDADPKEILVDWERTGEAVYALIDVDGPPGEIARDLNDMGEVLFTTGLWSGGNYALIPPPAPLSGSFPSGGETQTYDVDLIGYQSFNSDLKVTGWSHVRYTSGQAAGGDGIDTAWAQSLGQSAEHLADAVPFNSTNVLSMQPMGVDNSGRTFSRNSYAFYSPPEVMHEGRRIVVSGLPGNDPPVFLQPANGYYVDGQTWHGHADVSRRGSLVTNTASAIDNTPNKTYQLAMWDSSLGEVALPAGTNTWFYPIHLNDLPNGKPALAATTTGTGGDGVYLKNPVTGHMEKCESLSGKHIQIFAGDGSAITGDHQLWRNRKLTPMRNLCEPYGNLLDAGWDLRPLESNKHGAYLLVATGPNGEQENKLLLPVDLISDLNNDGQITAADNSFRDAALKSGATPEQIAKGTEYILQDDVMSNGAWDNQDQDGNICFDWPQYGNLDRAPAAGEMDDDAIAIEVKAPSFGVAWFTHEAIGSLSFFREKECLNGVAIDLEQPFDLSTQLPERLWIKFRPTVSTVDTIKGKLTFHIGKSPSEEWGKIDLPFTLVPDFGCENFFEAARNYIFERNTQVFLWDYKMPDRFTPAQIFRLCVMREEGTTARGYDAYANNKKGIGAVALAAGFNQPTVMINGNQCFFQAGYEEGVNLDLIWMVNQIADRCHGRVIIAGATASISSDNFDNNTQPAPGSDLAGPDPVGNFAGIDGIHGTADDIPNPRAANPGGKFFSLSDTTWNFAAGQATGTDAIGGLSSNYASSIRSDKAHQMIGRIPCVEQGKGCVFTATQIYGVGQAPAFAAAAKRSGNKMLSPSTDVLAQELLILDSGGGSLALQHIDPVGNLRKAYIGRKSATGFPYYVNNYIQFWATKPRP